MVKIIRAVLIAGLIVVTAPNGGTVYVAPANVQVIRPAVQGAIGRTEIVMSNGSQYVREPAKEVAGKFIQATK
jgi:hypothetical protein